MREAWKRLAFFLLLTKGVLEYNFQLAVITCVLQHNHSVGKDEIEVAWIHTLIDLPNQGIQELEFGNKSALVDVLDYESDPLLSQSYQIFVMKECDCCYVLLLSLAVELFKNLSSLLVESRSL